MKFKDTGFENAVREALQIKDGEITKDLLRTLNGVNVNPKATYGLGIPWHSNVSAAEFFPLVSFGVCDSENGLWLQDIEEHFNHIKSLRIHVQTNNLNFLKGFTNLVELFIEDSINQDWFFLTSLIKLRYLYLNNCYFEDLEVLSDLYKKQEQKYAKWKLKNPGNIFYFDKLENVAIKRSGIKNVTALSNCHNISELDLSHNEIVDLSPLVNIRSLYYLTLRYNSIRDITALKNRGNLYLLNLRHNQISDISIFEDFENSNMGRLFLEDNQITNFQPLSKLQLVKCDIPEYRAIRKEYSRTKLGKNKPATTGDIIGHWTHGLLYHTQLEDTDLIFDVSGKGFVNWYQANGYETFDFFEWSLEEGFLSIRGSKIYSFEEGELIGIEESPLGEQKIRVWTTKRKSLNGDELDALRFSEQFDNSIEEYMSRNSEDIWDNPEFQKVKEIFDSIGED